MKQHERASVWVIEDDPIMGESLVEALGLKGFAVRWWPSGDDALAALSTLPAPAVVACDMRLPGRSGEDT